MGRRRGSVASTSRGNPRRERCLKLPADHIPHNWAACPSFILGSQGVHLLVHCSPLLPLISSLLVHVMGAILLQFYQIFLPAEKKCRRGRLLRWTTTPSAAGLKAQTDQLSLLVSTQDHSHPQLAGLGSLAGKRQVFILKMSLVSMPFSGEVCCTSLVAIWIGHRNTKTMPK